MFPLHGVNQIFKLDVFKHKFLNVTSTCIGKQHYDICEKEHYQKNITSLFSECKTIQQFLLEQSRLYAITCNIFKYCSKHCSATQYTGKLYEIIKESEETSKYIKFWYYLFMKEDIQVNEECP